MRKKYVFRGLVIAVILCAVVFSACKQEADPQKKITVNGITATHNGRMGFVGLSNLVSGDLVAISIPVPINNGTVNMALYDSNTASPYSVPFTASGNFLVVFAIMDNSLDTLYWRGALYSKSITAGTTTIAFNEFINLSSVQQTPLGAKDVFSDILKELKK
jgi:hypothetical protein